MAKRRHNDGNKIIPKKSSRNSKDNKFLNMLNTLRSVLSDSGKPLEDRSFKLKACRSIAENLGKILAEEPSCNDRDNKRQLKQIKVKFNNYLHGFEKQCRNSNSSPQSSEGDVLPTQRPSR